MGNDKLKTDRRSFIKTAAVAAGAAGLSPLQAMASSLGSSSSASSRSIDDQANIEGKPNILIIMVDEQRYPTFYESADLTAFRKKYLTAQERIRSSGVEFHRHYCASVACAPSRASLFTGHYPSLHGLANTDGTAKSASDHDMFWLYRNSVPTIGNYFSEAGYRTYYKGKWHVSHADLLVPGTHNSLPSYDEQGNRDPVAEAKYLAADLLKDYGFSGWIGPEPHGADPLNTGASAKHAKGRDEGIAAQFIDLVDQLEASSDSTPWLSVCSFLNPHDIVFAGLFGRIGSRPNGKFDFTIEDFVPTDVFDENFLKTNRESLKSKPTVQRSYRRMYKRIFQPLLTTSEYARLYYQLHYEVDQQIGRVYERLEKSRFFDNTIVVFTADHGDLMGSHGGLHQKWFTAYEEALRVPLIFSCPSLIKPEVSYTLPTSHVDILPTLIGLAGLDISGIRDQLDTRFTNAKLPVGKDLSSIIYGNQSVSSINDPVYFMTDDDPSRGMAPYNVVGVTYEPVKQPSHVETVITDIDGSLWKYSRYFDNPKFWTGSLNPSNPATKDVYSRQLGRKEIVGTYSVPYKRVVKIEPIPDEFEMYNVTVDPMELNNLSGLADYIYIENQLKAILAQQVQEKRLVPDGDANENAYIPNYE